MMNCTYGGICGGRIKDKTYSTVDDHCNTVISLSCTILKFLKVICNLKRQCEVLMYLCEAILQLIC